PNYEDGLDRWIMGGIETQQANVPHHIVHLGEALAFVGLVRHFGRLAGVLTHALAGGDLFRDKFLGEVAPDFLKAPYPLQHLVSRPVLDYESDSFPFWGGLRRSELVAVAPQLAGDAPVWPEDPDVDQWLMALWDALGSTVDLETDLVSVYY